MVSLNRDALTEKVLAGERISAGEEFQFYTWALGRIGRASQRATGFGESEELRRARQRHCYLHCRSKHQLHERLQRLLQVLRVLSHGERRRSLRALTRAARSKTGRTFGRGRCSNPDARRTSSETAIRMVRRSSPSHSRKISAY